VRTLPVCQMAITLALWVLVPRVRHLLCHRSALALGSPTPLSQLALQGVQGAVTVRRAPTILADFAPCRVFACLRICVSVGMFVCGYVGMWACGCVGL
jgi:hypothetical protein